MANRKMPKANRACKICGTSPITGYKYCSHECKREAASLRRAQKRGHRGFGWHAWFGSAPYAEQRVRRANKIARHIRCCEACRTFFEPAVPSQRQLKGESDWGRFCSVACRDEPKRHATQLRTARARIVRLLSSWRTCEICDSRFVARQPSQRFCSDNCRRLEIQRPEAYEPRRCRECGEVFTPHRRGRQRIFCSKKCYKRNREHVYKSARRARLRGARVELVNSTRVFERDGYRCQLCGHKTLKSKRGSYHPKAPELDHIVPLAAGGEHSYRNTQCACRACNMAKSDGAGGQLLLIGEHA